jgi:TM2 domain-containing membrane protein YozV
MVEVPCPQFGDINKLKEVIMKKNIKAALLSAFVFPGLGQIYKGCRLKGLILIFAVNVLFLVAIALFVKEIYLLSLAGGFTGTPDPVKTADRILGGNPAFTWLLALFGCIWIYGVLDALLHSPKDRT